MAASGTDNPNNLYSDTPMIGVGILTRRQPASVGTSGTTGSTMTQAPEWALGTTVLLGAKAGYTLAGTRRLAMYVQATKKAAGIAINSQCTVTYPTVAAASVATGNWLNPSAAFSLNDYGWVIQNTAIV